MNALAAVAAATGAMAQSVTISGKYGVAYQQAIGGQGNLATTDGDIRFTATEDLGGGMKATAAMEIRVRGRGAADTGNLGGRNATVGLSGGFGSVTLGSVEASNGIISRGFAGAPVSLATGYDGAVLAAPANVDWFIYTTPQIMPGLTANVQRVDSIASPGSTKGVSGNVLGLNYAQGAVSAGIDYTDFSTDRTRLRASASYNLGVATVGIGYEDNKKTANDGGNQLALGVSVPLGAITLGAIYASNEEVAGGKTQGWGIGADYAFSKRTTLNVSFADRTKLAGAKEKNGDQYRIRLMHSF